MPNDESMKKIMRFRGKKPRSVHSGHVSEVVIDVVEALHQSLEVNDQHLVDFQPEFVPELFKARQGVEVTPRAPDDVVHLPHVNRLHQDVGRHVVDVPHGYREVPDDFDGVLVFQQ